LYLSFPGIKAVPHAGQLGIAITLGIGGLILLPRLISKPTSTTSTLTTVAQKPTAPTYKVFEQKDNIAYTLSIPNRSQYLVKPFVASTVASVAAVGAQTKALAVLNAGYFDPVNQKTTSTVVIDGREVANPRDNERLMQNPQLSGYLNAILNRSEFRIYDCNGQTAYDIQLHDAPVPTQCRLVHAVGGGPQLLPANTSQSEGFTDSVNGVLVRDAIGSQQPNARTAIGLKADGSLLWVMVAQRPNQQPSGMTLAELAEFMKAQGVRRALNLDGGTSSSLFYKGQAFYGKRDESGQPMARAVKSGLVLWLR
jgi:exopolysaccharide biosynthesis protein